MKSEESSNVIALSESIDLHPRLIFDLSFKNHRKTFAIYLWNIVKIVVLDIKK